MDRTAVLLADALAVLNRKGSDLCRLNDLLDPAPSAWPHRHEQLCRQESLWSSHDA